MPTAYGYILGVPGYGGGGDVDWKTLRLTEPSSGSLLSEWWFDEGSGTTVSDQVGSADFTGITNGSWISQGLRLSSGKATSASISGAQTLVLLCKPPKDSTTSEWNSTFRGATYYGPQVTDNATWHSASVRNVVPMYYRAATGQANYRPSRGNWILVFCQSASAAASTVVLGAKSDGTLSVSQLDIAWAAVYSATLTSAERTTIYDMARQLIKSRGAYLDWRDCPVKVDIAALWGQSNAEGRALIADLSAGDQARTTPSGVYINRRDTYASEQLELGVNQTTTTPAVQFGPEMQMAWDAEDGGSGLYIAKYGVGATYLADTANGNDWNTAELPTSGSLNAALRSVWQTEADMLNAGIGPRLLGMCWMQGEQDALNATYGAAYEANLTSLIAKFREQVGDSTARIVIGRIRDDDPAGDPTAQAAVRAAQVAVAAADSNVYWIDTDSMPLNVDNVHYAAAGQKLLGTAFYSALQA